MPAIDFQQLKATARIGDDIARTFLIYHDKMMRIIISLRASASDDDDAFWRAPAIITARRWLFALPLRHYARHF